MSFRSGIGFDVHRFAEGRPLVLGGVEVLSDRGLDGHSDADVLTHAIMDALLGAAGAGRHRRPLPRHRRVADARLVDLLRRVAELLDDRGLRVVDVDATVLARGAAAGAPPRAMREALAAALASTAPGQRQVEHGRGMGFVGRGEGIAALAVATIEQMV